VTRLALLMLAIGMVAAPGLGVGEPQQTAGSATAAAQKPTVTFQFDHAGLSVPRYTIVLREDGSGSYHAEEVERRSADSAVQQVSVKQVDSPLTVSFDTAAKIFATARSLNRFNMFCGTKAKNIAETGQKILSYAGPEGNGTCTYHYSDDKNVTVLTNMFYAISYTLEVGRRLDFERRFDRLGLDAELLSLEQAVQEKNALELTNIAPTLNAIAGNVDLMQRVRTRASKLLENSAAK
jgi:hypothetical protein